MNGYCFAWKANSPSVVQCGNFFKFRILWQKRRFLVVFKVLSLSKFVFREKKIIVSIKSSSEDEGKWIGGRTHMLETSGTK